jgi:hypothetical protein
VGDSEPVIKRENGIVIDVGGVLVTAGG